MEKSVSVIIPLYNYGRYLAECVDSVINQTYPVKEIIIVDDGSTDDSLDIAYDLSAKYKIVSVITKENGGLSSARNAGIEEADGEYIMCLDADDKLVPGAIEEHVKLLTDPMAIAQCGLMEFGERYVVAVPNPNSTLERIMQANTIFCNAMFPKKAWEEIGGFDESATMRWGFEDWEAWIRMLAAGYHVNTSDFIALRYRVHEGQMTQATSHPHAQELYKYIYEKHKDLYDGKGLTVVGFRHD